MTIARRSSILLFLLAALAFSAAGQRTRRPTPKPKPTPYVNAVVAQAKEKTSNQLSNVNRFIDVLGPIAQNIESLDAQNRIKPLSKEAYAENQANKQKVLAALRNLKAGLSTLETDFRTKPLLKKFLPRIQGISALAANSEDSMLAGKFVASKDPLREISRKLADTYAVLR